MRGAKATSKSLSMQRTQGMRTPSGNMSCGYLRRSCSGPALDPIASTGVRSSSGFHVMPNCSMASAALYISECIHYKQLSCQPVTSTLSSGRARPLEFDFGGLVLVAQLITVGQRYSS